MCESTNQKLAELSVAEFQAVCETIEEDVYQVLGTANAVKALKSYGSGGAGPVREQLERWKLRVKDEE
jgi:argininosuccinate lyase